MKNARFLAFADVRHALRARETLVWLFVMPIVFFYFIGTVTQGSGGAPTGSDHLVFVAGEDSGFLADEIARRLEQNEFQLVRPGPGVVIDPDDPRLEIPAHFTATVLAGGEAKLVLTPGESERRADFDRFRIARASYTVLADLVVSAEAGEQPTPEAFATLAAAPRALTLEVKPAGKRKKIPTGFEQTIPGTMVMFTMVLLLTSGTVMIVIERNQGLLRRLASSPIGRGEIVLGKWGGMMALAIVQISFAMIAGTLLFKVGWGPDLPMVLLVVFSWAALVASLGILLGSVARSEGQAIAIGVLSSNVLAALGGCWWPIEVTPSWMQKLALFIPTGWAMDALHKLSIFEAGAASALPHVVGMLAAALVFGWAGSKLFRFH